MENARRENRELENKSANPPKLEWFLIGKLSGRLRRSWLRTDRPYQTDGSDFHQQKNDALNYTAIFMLRVGTGGVVWTLSFPIN